MYLHNKEAPKYIKQKVTKLKVEVENSIIIVIKFNTQLSVMHETAKIKKGMEDLNYTINQLDLTDKYKTFYK